MRSETIVTVNLYLNEKEYEIFKELIYLKESYEYTELYEGDEQIIKVSMTDYETIEDIADIIWKEYKSNVENKISTYRSSVINKLHSHLYSSLPHNW